LFPSLTGGEVVKIAQLASIAGAQGRIAQPETPVTLQFQGNKFTLSHSQLRQLTAGQPLQLQGTYFKTVSFHYLECSILMWTAHSFWLYIKEIFAPLHLLSLSAFLLCEAGIRS